MKLKIIAILSSIVALIVMAFVEETDFTVYSIFQVCFYFIITGLLLICYCWQ